MAIEKNALGMTMQINEDFINNLAKQLVSESIMATIGGGDKFVEQIVKEIMMTKVDPSNGRVSTYSSSIPYIQWLINTVIRDEVSGTVAEVLDEKRKDIRKVIRKELMKDSTVEAFCESFTHSVSRAVGDYWKAKIDITFVRDDA